MMDSWFDACLTSKLCTCETETVDDKEHIGYAPDLRKLKEALRESPTNLAIELENGTLVTFKNLLGLCDFFYLQGVLSVVCADGGPDEIDELDDDDNQ